MSFKNLYRDLGELKTRLEKTLKSYRKAIQSHKESVELYNRFMKRTNVPKYLAENHELCIDCACDMIANDELSILHYQNYKKI
jgi:hypothetical protein